MKKLLIIAGVMALCVTAKAASFTWSFSSGTTYAGYKVYLANSATYATVAALQSDLFGGSGNTSTLVASSRSATASGTVSGLTATTAYDFYYVVVNADETSYWVTSKQTVTTNAEDAGAASVSIAAATGTALLSGAPTGSFAVPEPTSGLLMLLGVAGLALRRRRA